MPQLDYCVAEHVLVWISALFVITYLVIACLILPLLFFLLKIRRKFIHVLVFYKKYLYNFKNYFNLQLYKFSFVESFCSNLIAALEVCPDDEVISRDLFFSFFYKILQEYLLRSVRSINLERLLKYRTITKWK